METTNARWWQRKSLKVYVFWVNNLACLTRLLASLFTIILLILFHNDHLSCKDSFFAYAIHNSSINATEATCHLTGHGTGVVISYFTLDGLSLLVLLILYYFSIFVPFLNENVCCKDICQTNLILQWICFIVLIVPVYLTTLLIVIFHIVYPKIFEESDSVKWFHQRWMGYYTSKKKTSHSILVVQTLYLLVNGLELTIGSGAMLSYYNNHYSRFYLTFMAISAVLRMFVFGSQFLEACCTYVCDDCLGVCCNKVRLRRRSEKTSNINAQFTTNISTETDHLMDHQT